MGITREDKIRWIEEKQDYFNKRLGKCDICPRNCGVNRLRGEKGYCGTAQDLVVYTAFLHRGEEPAISGERGSGTVFFSGCPLRCVYCQNYRFSHSGEGKVITPAELAAVMLKLQARGAHNLNLVTPTHFLPQILSALLIALEEGFNLPVVYNTSGYEQEEIIELIGGIVDIYLTDMKYIVSSLAERYSHAPDYPVFNQKVIKKMYQQKAVCWQGNLLQEGVIIRHLVLPSHFEDTIRVISWIKENTPGAILSLMFQYQPFFKAKLYPPIARPVNAAEYDQIRRFLEEIELHGWVQELAAAEDLSGVYFEAGWDDLFDSSVKG